jgi:glycerate kinase
VRVLIAFDKFKGSLSAGQACAFTARALRRWHRDWELDLCPLADGGEGFARILTRAAGGRFVPCHVTGPRGAPTDAPLGLVAVSQIPAAAQIRLGLRASAVTVPGSSRPMAEDGTVAIIEMATASGLALLPPAQRDPWRTTSAGTGQLIRAAAGLGARLILLGAGGSATNDLGLGALSAMGFEFHSASGEKICPPLPVYWPRIAHLAGEISSAIPPIRIAGDVTNPLLGPSGATAIYGPQKGLRPEDRGRLESVSGRLAWLLCEYCHRPAALIDAPGSGAAGGLAFGLVTAARAELLPGFDLVADWLGLEARLAAADLVITGEGCFDASSRQGKAAGSLAGRARQLGKPVHIFAGQANAPATDGMFLHVITPTNLPPSQAFAGASGFLARAVTHAFSLSPS